MTGKTDPGALVQAYQYDSVQNRTLLIDPNPGYHSYTYDPLNRQATYQRPGGGINTGQYDRASRITTAVELFDEQRADPKSA